MGACRVIKKGTKVSDKIREAIVKRYKNNPSYTVSQLCKLFGVSDWTVRDILRSNGIEPRKVKIPWEPWEDETLLNMHKAGNRPSDIARVVNRPLQSVIYRMQILGLKEKSARKSHKKQYCELHELKVGNKYKTSVEGVSLGVDNTGISLIYLGKEGKHHIFQAKKGKWKVAYTDAQMMDLKLEVA